jgi:exosortase A-associated hydrolase 1
MTRRVIAFPCGGARLYGTLDCAGAHGGTGLLIVSGGNEIRAGAHAGQAQLAARLAEAAGVSVFRFDRRGIGDSAGDNAGWRGSRDDIAAALGTFRASLPALRRVVGYGLCDAASALMLHAATLGEHGFDALVLANPWMIDGDSPGHSPAALRRRYLARLGDPRALWRLVSGQVDLGRLAQGLGRAARARAPHSALVDELHAALARFAGPVTLLAASSDRIGAHFCESWPADDPRLTTHPGRSHSFTDDPDSTAWLFDRLVEATASRH